MTGFNPTRIVRAAVVLWTASGVAISLPIVPANGTDTIEGQIDTETTTEMDPFEMPAWQQYTRQIRVELAGQLGIATSDLAAALNDVQIQPPEDPLPHRHDTARNSEPITR